MEFDLTPEEKKAIAALKRLAKKWPDSLWLFSAQSLHVMRKTEDGRHAYGGENVSSTGIDPGYIIATIDIEADGGDW